MSLNTAGQACSLNHDVWRLSIEQGEDTFCFILTKLQANFCRLQRVLLDENSSIRVKKIIFANRTERLHTHGKDYADLVWRQHELLTQKYLVHTVNRFDFPQLRLMNALKKRHAIKTYRSNTDKLKAFVNGS